MTNKTDTMVIKILRFIILIGAVTSDEIKVISNTHSYTEKLIASLKEAVILQTFLSYSSGQRVFSCKYFRANFTFFIGKSFV